MGMRSRRRGTPSGRERAPEAGREREIGHDAREGLLAGYRLVRRIAVGERAEVYLATPAMAEPGEPGEAPELVALRLYGPDADAAAVAVELEALTADAGRSLPAPLDLASGADGRTCVVVERIPGERLSQVISERTLSAGEAVTVLAPIAAGVRALAEAGFVHTRLAASDVLFDGSGRPRIIGLGALVRLDPGLPAVDRSALLREGHAALSRLVAEVAAATRPAAALDGVLAISRSGLEARPFAPYALALEHELFRAAAPLPVSGIARFPSAGAHVPARIIPEPGARPIIGPPPIVAGCGRASSVGAPADASVAPAAPTRGVVTGRLNAGQQPAPAAAAEPVQEFAVGRSTVVAAETSAAEDPADRLLEGELPLLAALRAGRWRDRLRAVVARRRAPVLVAALGGGAVLVVLLTLVPPGGSPPGAKAAPEPGTAASAGADEPGASTDDVGIDAADDADATADPGPDGSADAVAEPTELIAVAAELLELRESCLDSGDRACLAAVVQPGSALESADLERLASGQHGADAASYDLGSLTVGGTMGAAVLLDLVHDDAERQPASLLMVRSEAGWRLREIFD